jgi:glutathione synthase
MLKRSARDEEICARIGPELARLNLVFAGVDIIGDYLTEINITSPTGLIAANKLGGLSLERSLWDCFEAKISARR